MLWRSGGDPSSEFVSFEIPGASPHQRGGKHHPSERLLPAPLRVGDFPFQSAHLMSEERVRECPGLEKRRA